MTVTWETIRSQKVDKNINISASTSRISKNQEIEAFNCTYIFRMLNVCVYERERELLQGRQDESAEQPRLFSSSLYT